MSDNEQVVYAPKSSSHTQVEQLAYLESFDVPVDKFYAFVAYKETKIPSGKWVVRIKSSVTAGTVFDPGNASLKNSLKKAAAREEEYLVWGFNLKPKEGETRLVENRILFDADGKPTFIEMHLITRKADFSPKEEKVAKFPWPG